MTVSGPESEGPVGKKSRSESILNPFRVETSTLGCTYSSTHKNRLLGLWFPGPETDGLRETPRSSGTPRSRSFADVLTNTYSDVIPSPSQRTHGPCVERRSRPTPVTVVYQSPFFSGRESLTHKDDSYLLSFHSVETLSCLK